MCRPYLKNNTLEQTLVSTYTHVSTLVHMNRNICQKHLKKNYEVFMNWLKILFLTCLCVCPFLVCMHRPEDNFTHWSFHHPWMLGWGPSCLQLIHVFTHLAILLAYKEHFKTFLSTIIFIWMLWQYCLSSLSYGYACWSLKLHGEHVILCSAYFYCHLPLPPFLLDSSPSLTSI